MVFECLLAVQRTRSWEFREDTNPFLEEWWLGCGGIGGWWSPEVGVGERVWLYQTLPVKATRLSPTYPELYQHRRCLSHMKLLVEETPFTTRHERWAGNLHRRRAHPHRNGARGARVGEMQFILGRRLLHRCCTLGLLVRRYEQYGRDAIGAEGFVSKGAHAVANVQLAGIAEGGAGLSYVSRHAFVSDPDIVGAPLDLTRLPSQSHAIGDQGFQERCGFADRGTL